jgi:tetratricopeptide (TPR) repeat protein
MRYSAFISYNHRDRRWAAWLHRELERYRVPSALLGRPAPWGMLEHRLPAVFQDREELAASTSLAASVCQALEESHALIVICSRAGAASKWVNEEVRAFAALGRADRIWCLIVPEPDDGGGLPVDSNQLFPAAILELLGEPLAADARPTGDGRHGALLKLIAGVIGVRYDELRQREQARRHKRLLQLATAAVIGFILMSSLAAVALVSRQQAVRDRDLAQQKTLTAQRTTEFVKSLFQVSDPSEAKGQTITAAEILERGARRIEGSLEDEPDVRAELMSTLGEVYLGLGSFQRADDLVRRSLALRVSNPETLARQLIVYGASRNLQGDYDGSAELYARAEALVRDRELSDPELMSRAALGRAEALAALDKLDEARRLIGRTVASDSDRAGPDSIAAARSLEMAGLVEQFAANYPQARRHYERALAIRYARGGRLHPKVSDDLNQLGTVAYLAGEPRLAEGYWRRAVAIDTQVLGTDHPELAATLNNLARVLLEQRRFAEAERLLARSASNNIRQRGPNHPDLAFILPNLGLAAAGRGRFDLAELNLRRGLVIAMANSHRNRGPIMTDLASLHCRRGDYARAEQLLDRAGPLMLADYPADPWRAAWVDNTRGDCLRRQGRVEPARALLASSAPVIAARWPAESLYGWQARQRSTSMKSTG